jgi:hypothetical protein
MKRQNTKKQIGVTNPKIGLFSAMLATLMLRGIDAPTANKRAAHVSFGGENPIYYPQKHTVMNYATQNRLAKKRRKSIQ